MKTFLFLFIIMSITLVNAQNEYAYEYNAIEAENIPIYGTQIELRKQNMINTMDEILVSYKKGIAQEKTKKTIKASFDENGFLIKSESYNYKNELEKKTSYIVNDSGQILEKAITNGKGKLLSQYTKTYNSDGLITGSTYIKNGKVISKYTLLRNGRNISERCNFKRGGEKLSSRFVYTFQSDNQLKTTQMFNGKGKLKHTWNHDCLPEGELLEARKDTTTICRIKESTGGESYITYTKNVDEKGVLSTTTSWYKKDFEIDSMYIKTEGKHPSLAIYKYLDNHKTFILVNLDNKNDTLYMFKRTYSENGNLLASETWLKSKKNGLEKRIWYIGIENDKGLLINTKHFNYKGLQNESIIDYSTF